MHWLIIILLLTETLTASFLYKEFNRVTIQKCVCVSRGGGGGVGAGIKV